MRITILAVAALVSAVSVPAHAADLYSAALYSGTSGEFFCSATNKGTKDITVTVQIKEPVAGGVLTTCGPVVVVPTDALACTDATADTLAFCKVTTSNVGNTRSVFSVVNSGGGSQSRANTVPR